MQVSIGAKCWDGDRRKTLIESIKEVMVIDPVNMETRKMKFSLGHIIPFGLLTSIVPAFGSHASAQGINEPAAVAAMAVPEAIKDKILHAFDPLIDLALSLSYPIAGVMLVGGCLLIMIGNKEKGLQILQNAAIGYILVQLSPMFLKLLVSIGGTVS